MPGPESLQIRPWQRSKQRASSHQNEMSHIWMEMYER
jgi:hypothetical protein